ncbi:MAG: helix-turn-helix transcriptional regulator [Terriglobia bacterium]
MPNEGLSSVEPSKKGFNLTQLERQAIALIVSGYSSEEMAMKFGIGEPAVRQHVTCICDKLSVSNEFELILFALHHRLIDTHQSAQPGD